MIRVSLILRIHKMPVGLAALLLIVFKADLRIIKAIDMNMEWKKISGFPRDFTKGWYEGWIGHRQRKSSFEIGTFIWPYPSNRRYN